MSVYRAIFILFLLLISHVSQGQVVVTVLEMQQQQGKQQRNFSLYLSQSRVANLDEQQQLQELYDRTTKILYVLDHQQQNYRSFSLPKAKVYADALQALFAKFEKKLAQLPEKQRQKQAKRLNKFFNAGNADRLVNSQYSATEQQGRFGGIACDWYKITEQQALKGQTCVANPKALKNGVALLEMLQSMNEIYSLIIGSVQGKLHLNIPNSPMAPLAKFGKIPLSIERQTSGLAMQLVAVRELSVESNLFKLPDNFTELLDGIATPLSSAD
ncbi:MAG: hypothetical protein ACPG52_02350 [Cognaticolwellia sp.]